MSNPRICYLNRWRYGDMFATWEVTYQHPQFPLEYTQGDSPSDFYRTRYGAGSGNGRFWVSDARKYIDFVESSGELTATLTTGYYNGTTLAAEIKIQMEAVGAFTYTVVYNEDTGKFRISASSNFSLLWNSGTHKATDISDMCGYSDAADDTGTDTYLADYRRNYFEHATATSDLLTAVDINFIALINHNVQAGATVTFQYAEDSGFSTGAGYETLSPLNAVNHFALLGTTRTKRYWRLRVADYDNPQGYTQIGPIILGKSYELNRAHRMPYQHGKDDASELDFSDSLNLYAQERPRIDTKIYSFEGLDTSSANEVLSMLEECGVHKPWILCTDPATPNTSSYFVRNAELAYPECQFTGYWNWEASLKEIV